MHKCSKPVDKTPFTFTIALTMCMIFFSEKQQNPLNTFMYGTLFWAISSLQKAVTEKRFVTSELLSRGFRSTEGIKMDTFKEVATLEIGFPT